MYIKNLIEPEIAKTSRHMFLYGNNSFKRERLLKGIADKYPFIFGGEESSVVYVDDIGLPDIKETAKGLDRDRINSIAVYYLDFAITDAILKKINASNNKNSENMKPLIKEFNKISNPDGNFKNGFNSLEDIQKCVKQSKDYWAYYYEAYLKTGDETLPNQYFDKLNIQFIPFLADFTGTIKRATKNSSPFQIILDRKKNIPLPSVQAINSLMGLRCNDTMSIKVACEPDEWESSRDLYGNLTQYVHDYTIVELDESFSKRMDEAKTSFGIDDDL